MSQKRIASQMNGTSDQTGDNPLKGVKAMLEENKKVALSKNKTEEFGHRVLRNNKAIESYEDKIKVWERRIRRDKLHIQGIQRSNQKHEEDIEKNRLEVLELKQEEEALKILTKFLEPALEKVGMSPEKETNGDEEVTADVDGKKVISEVEKVTTGGEDTKKIAGR